MCNASALGNGMDLRMEWVGSEKMDSWVGVLVSH